MDRLGLSALSEFSGSKLLLLRSHEHTVRPTGRTYVQKELETESVPRPGHEEKVVAKVVHVPREAPD